MKLDKLGLVVFQDSDLIDLIYHNQTDLLPNLVCEDSPNTKKLKELVPILLESELASNIDLDEFDQVCQSDWFVTDEYKNMDIEGYLTHVCPKQNYQRLIEELQEFRARNMLPLLRTLKYVVDTLRQHNIVWGVGRGSSVASYVLYLLGVHKIDSIKYDLDWQEFLR
jgi:DNA polymerase III alpha subunit